MIKIENSYFKNWDWSFLYTVLTINVIALLNTFSSTLKLPSQSVSPLFVKQAIFMALGWLIFIIFNFLRIELIMRWAYAIYGFSLGLLAFTLIFGRIGLGAQRWLDLGFFNVQPSEFAKLSMILVLTRYLTDKGPRNRPMGWKDLIIPLLLILLPTLLIVKQPDLGSGGVLALMSFSLLVFYGVRWQVLVLAFSTGLLVLPLAWRFGLKDYQKKRIETFIRPEADPKGSGYNSIQSKIAIGSGRLFGKGFLQGTQSKFEFLPERHTDFTFSVLSEEHGFFGAASVIVLLSILLILLVNQIKQVSEISHILILAGSFFYFFWHSTINIGMVIGLFPIVGIPLPFFSYGGSHVLTSFALLGLAFQSIRRKYMF